MTHGIVTGGVAEASPALAPAAAKKPKRYSDEYFAQQAAEIAARKEREFREYLRTAHTDEGVCYFLGVPGELVKIGFSRTLWRRVQQIKATSGPYRLKLLATAPGGRTTEMHYHRQFEATAFGGEWFEWSPEIEAEIARLTEVSE